MLMFVCASSLIRHHPIHSFWRLIMKPKDQNRTTQQTLTEEQTKKGSMRGKTATNDNNMRTNPTTGNKLTTGNKPTTRK
jgi:hypothetical protein